MHYHHVKIYIIVTCRSALHLLCNNIQATRIFFRFYFFITCHTAFSLKTIFWLCLTHLSFVQFSADDVVGCVEISLNRLRCNQVAGWQPIVRPMIPSQQGVLDQIWKYLNGPQPKAELKLKASLDATDSQRGCISIVQQLHSESSLFPQNLNIPEPASPVTSSQLVWMDRNQPQYQKEAVVPAFQSRGAPPQYQTFVEEAAVLVKAD
jgi:hypothetical protein